MEYRLNILGSLQYLANVYASVNWDKYTLRMALSYIELEDYSEDDFNYWLEQLNRKGN